jgi:hypothetical protein
LYHVAVLRLSVIMIHDYDTCGKQGRTTIIE